MRSPQSVVALKDIAAAVGVSVGTVSRILNQGRAHLYSPETCKRVTEASRELGYRPNRSAQAMRLRKTHMIGFAGLHIDPGGELRNYQIHPFLIGLSHRLSRAGYHATLVERSDLGDPADPAQPWSVQERFLDALVVHYGFSDRAMRFADNVGVPLIWWDSGLFEPYGCIYRDEVEVGRQVTRKLIELGHKRIGYAVGQRGWEDYQAKRPVHYSYIQRFETYLAEMRAHGLEPVPVLGYETASFAEQLSSHKLTALITQGATDAVLQQATQLLKWRVPQDLSVAVLDREARILPRGIKPGGMLYDRYQVGEQAAEMALSMLDGEQKAVPSVRYLGEFQMGDTILPYPDS